MDSEHVKLLFVVVVMFGAVVTIPVSLFWLDHRTKTRALDLLRIYAERGEEPPASVLQAMPGFSSWARPPQSGEPPRQTRGGHLAHAAGNAIFTAGFTALTWWRFSTSGAMGSGVIVLSLAALFFAAGLAARLVGAYYAKPQ
jgi:hypothetical protein